MTGNVRAEFGYNKANEWHRHDLPPHNVQVLEEYGCVVTYNSKTKKWKNTKGRIVKVKCWKFKEE